MKVRRLWMLAGIVLAMGIAACVGTSKMNREPVPPGDPVIGLLSNGSTQLNVNINALSKRMNNLQQASAGTDPVLQELQALDLSGWQLHSSNRCYSAIVSCWRATPFSGLPRTRERKDSCWTSGANTGSNT